MKETSKNQPSEDLKSVKRLHRHDKSIMQSILKFLYQPIDPSSLGITRVLFGFLMIFDITQERGMVYINLRWGDPKACEFPLLSNLPILSADWMHILYLSMIAAAIGICIGFYYRIASIWLALGHWYLILIDKTAWNNHTYLFGLFTIFFSVTNANRWWSVDGVLNQKINNVHIPRWNLALFQFQIFLVYFLAGVKKLNSDWITGSSVTTVGSHWVFAPLRLLLTTQQISQYVLHYGGLIFDLIEGYLLFFNITRPLGIALGIYFHICNSQIFTIGIFPYAMLATLHIFCNPDWPKKVIMRLSPRWRKYFLLDTPPKYSASNCYYNDYNPDDTGSRIQQFNSQNRLTMAILAGYVTLQLFLPFSHFITQGYNTWNERGLYGYSWDMMVNSWSYPKIKILVVDLSNGKHFIGGADSRFLRWSTYPSMIKQYGNCLAKQMKTSYEIKQPAVYLDIWKSMNGRFRQRLINPKVDIVSAPWSPWKKTPWLMPLLANLTNWRNKMPELKKRYSIDDKSRIIRFYADFPGYTQEVPVPAALQANLTVLEGQVEVNASRYIYKLNPKMTIRLPSNVTHTVTVTSERPAAYFYRIENATLARILAEEKENIKNRVEDYSPKSYLTYFSTSVRFVTGNIIEFLKSKVLIYYHIAINTFDAIQNIIESENITDSTLDSVSPSNN
ncbi:uncharacterized protein TRIADDRAFT_30165 [Trichoplax adhaerens]|uniref:HTTM-like domain-containing protein n=1 Tax=Trichoplax adhaerens TaxID=10228 RepID=B3S6S6_TRIAD|nr:hypothetical protein TRIADDRAFT_30165 [Trichoplax adhaerens]EDV21673.1 hypothetical protein TRIADDRAFT_30165 [Trichoplax adhaerens]|eukprot:XP_002115821.1 hypothetical protein TRIADDRAFT_30165 [Trichoplax adhaerens]